jgi:hypothetical protein
MSLFSLFRDAFVTFILVSIAASAIAAGMSTTEKLKDATPTEIIIINGKPTPIPGPHPNCNVMEFQRLAYTINDTTKRKQIALSWLTNHGPDCRDYDLTTIHNNTSLWLGTSDGIEIKTLIYTLYYHTKRPTVPAVPKDTMPQLPLSYKDKK